MHRCLEPRRAKRELPCSNCSSLQPRTGFGVNSSTLRVKAPVSKCVGTSGAVVLQASNAQVGQKSNEEVPEEQLRSPAQPQESHRTTQARRARVPRTPQKNWKRSSATTITSAPARPQTAQLNENNNDCIDTATLYITMPTPRRELIRSPEPLRAWTFIASTPAG